MLISKITLRFSFYMPFPFTCLPFPTNAPNIRPSRNQDCLAPTGLHGAPKGLRRQGGKSRDSKSWRFLLQSTCLTREAAALYRYYLMKESDTAYLLFSDEELKCRGIPCQNKEFMFPNCVASPDTFICITSKNWIPHIGNIVTQIAKQLKTEFRGYLQIKTQWFKEMMTIACFKVDCK